MQTAKPQCLEASPAVAGDINRSIATWRCTYETMSRIPVWSVWYNYLFNLSKTHRYKMNQNDKINTASKQSKLAQNQGHLYRCVCACVCLCVRLWYIKKQWYTLLVTCGNECKWVDHDLSKFLYAGTAIVSNGQRSTKHCIRTTIFKEHPFSTVGSRYKPLLHDTSCRACSTVIWI